MSPGLSVATTKGGGGAANGYDGGSLTRRLGDQGFNTHIRHPVPSTTG